MYKFILLFILFLSSSIYGNDLDNALIEAIGNGKLTEVKTLIEKGVNINAKDNDGFTALMYASNSGYTELVKILKNAGAVE